MAKWFERFRFILLRWLVKCLGAANFLKLFGGKFHVEHWRDGQLLSRTPVPNGITDIGMNTLLDVMFDSGTQITTWYIGLVNNSGFSAFANADTMASHSGWTEFTAYDEAARVTWNPEEPSSRAISNSVTSADFTINATGTLKGIFVTSVNTKGGATGILWSTAAFSTTVNVVDNDVIKITYTVSG